MADATLSFNILTKYQDRGAKKAEKDFAGLGRKITDVAKVATVALGAGLAVLGRNAVSVASDINEAQSKVNVVFGKSATEVQKFAQVSAASLGVSKRAALDATGTFGNLFVSMKLSQPEAAKLSVNMVKLASDMASFNNASPQETLEALRAGLVGETEPLKRFGVNLNEAAIKAEALRLGLVKSVADTDKVGIAQKRVAIATENLRGAIKKYGEDSSQARRADVALEASQNVLKKAVAGTIPQLNAAQKAQAAYSLIVQQTKTAQGDFARTSDSVANQQKTLRARFEDLQGEIGGKLLPVVNKILSKFLELVGWIEKNQKTASILAGTIGGLVVTIASINVAIRAWTAATAAWTAVTKVAAVVAKAFFLVLRMNSIGLVITAIALLVAGLVTAYKKSETFRKIVDGAFRGVAAAAKFMWEVVIKPVLKLWLNMWFTVVGGILNGAAKAFGWVPGVGGKLKKAADEFNKFRDRANAALDGISDENVWVKLNASMSDTAIQILKANQVSLSREHLNRRAAGGILPGSPSDRDNMMIWAASGEYLVNAKATQKHRDLLEAINADRVGAFARGGLIPGAQNNASPTMQAYAQAMDKAGGNLAKTGAGLLSRTMKALFKDVFVGGLSGVPTNVSGNAATVRRVFADMFGWAAHWPATYKLVTGESGFRNTAQNPTSSAYGMFQFLDATWRTVGGHKTSDPYLQSVYGGRYIRNAYGNPSRAYSKWLSRSPHWYDQGGWLPAGLSLAYNGTGRPERVLPPPGRGGDGVTINVTVQGSLVGGSVRELARELRPVIVAAVSEGRNDLRLRLG